MSPGEEPKNPARLLAFRVLNELEAGFGSPRRRTSNPDHLLARFEKEREIGPEDLGLARDLVFGILKYRRLLDHVLASFSRRPMRNLERPLRTLLRMGLYQLRILTRIPERAAVFETVGLARAVARPGAHRMVNAVLRAYLRSDYPWPRSEGEPELYLRVGLSHPDWIVDRLLAQLGEAGARERMEHANRTPKTFLRVSRRISLPAARQRLLEEGVRTAIFPMAPDCLVVIEGHPLRTEAHREGLVHIQDAGSQFIGWLLPLEGARSVLDLCAAPGGKATILAERLHSGSLIASDLRFSRLRVLEGIASRLAILNLRLLAADAGCPPFPPGSFDRILLDAPCSGLGTLARNPDLKWTSSPRRVRKLARTAAALVGAAARLLTPGGLLLYSTCSLEEEETTDLVNHALGTGPGLERAPLGQGLEQGMEDRIGPFLDEDGFLRIAPETSGTDGYFAALLRRSGTPGD